MGEIIATYCIVGILLATLDNVIFASKIQDQGERILRGVIFCVAWPFILIRAILYK